MPRQVLLELSFSGADAIAQAGRAAALLSEVGADAHAERARLHAIVAAASVFASPESAAESAATAAAEAIAAGDQISNGWALIASAVVDLGPGAVARRLEATDAALRIARDTGVREFVRIAHFLHLSALAELGRIAELDVAMGPAGEFMRAFPWLEATRHVAWFRCLRATIDGQADSAEQLAHQAFLLAEQQGDPDGLTVLIGQIAIIRWMQGRVVELEPEFLHARQAAPHEPVWAVSLAWMWLRQGRRSAARSLVATLPPVGALPVDRNWLATTCILATVAAELGETERAAELRAALAPFGGRLVTIGLGVTCWGTVDRPLALLAAALGDVESAIRHYRAAIESAGTAGAHAWLAEAQWELATILSERAGPGDAEEALELASEAVAAGRALGLYGVERGASEVLATLQATDWPGSEAPPSVDAAERPRIRVLGAFEVLATDGSPARWRSRKARQLLKILVARRGAAISRDSLMHLLWPDEPPAALANRFSVALTVVRRALDPHRAFAGDHYLQNVGGLVRLRINCLEVDAEELLCETQSALAGGPLTAEAATRLAAALELHRGEAFADEPELWAEPLRREIHLAFFAAAHALADAATNSGDDTTCLDAYRRILASDPFDQRAHQGLIEALTRLGAHGQATAARQEYAARMRELSIPDDPQELAGRAGVDEADVDELRDAS